MWVAKYQKSADWKDYPLYLSEYGGIQWDVQGVGGWGYGNGPKTEEEYMERYEYLTKTLMDSPHLCEKSTSAEDKRNKTDSLSVLFFIFAFS